MGGGHWVHSSIEIFCDNLALVQVVTSDKTREPILGACIRNIWLLSAVFDIDLRIQPIRGKKNTIADLLSRLFSNKPIDLSLFHQIQEHYTCDKIPYTCFKLDLDL